MPELGKTNQLTIIKIVGDVLTLDAKEFGNIDIMNDDLVFKYNVGQVIEVFLYLDSEGTVAASFDKGFANVAEFARLKVVAVTKFGAFMDWGIAKDLLCPFKEQKADLVIGSFYNVYIYVDDLTKRIVATTKFEKFICTDKPEITEGQQVNIFVLNQSILGFNAIVENKYLGLLYKNEIFTDLQPGQKLPAIVKKIRDDNKIDLRLFKNDFQDITTFEQMIMDYLEAHNGSMHINDESEPEVIYKTFGISKKNFKKALGGLYKLGKIDLKDTAVKLLK